MLSGIRMVSSGDGDEYRLITQSCLHCFGDNSGSGDERSLTIVQTFYFCQFIPSYIFFHNY